MPVAIALIFVGIVLAISLIRLIWSILILLPFYIYIGAAVYLVWRINRKEAELNASVKRETDRQRLFNEHEMRAWRSLVEEEQRNGTLDPPH